MEYQEKLVIEIPALDDLGDFLKGNQNMKKNDKPFLMNEQINLVDVDYQYYKAYFRPLVNTRD